MWVGGRVPVGVTVGVSVGMAVGVSVGVGVSVSVAEGIRVGKNWVGVASSVAVGSRGVAESVSSRGTTGVLVAVAGGKVTRGVGVSETGGGAVLSAMTPKQ